MAPANSEHSTLVKRIGLNSLWLALARVVSQGLMLLFTALAARALGEAGFGQYAFVAAIVYVGNVLTTFGMDTLLIREIAKSRAAAMTLVPAAFWVQMALSALFVAMIFAITAMMPEQPRLTLGLRIYTLSLIPLAFYTIFSAVLRARERMDALLASNVALASMQVLAASIVLATRQDLAMLFAQLLITQVAAAILAGALCVRRAPDLTFDFRTSIGALGSIARTAVPFAALAALGVLSQRLGILLLPALAGDRVTGEFSAAARIVEALKIAPQALLGALLPVLSRRAFDAHLFRAPLFLSMAFGALAALVLSFAAPVLIDVIYGARFAAASSVLQIMVWSLIPYAFTATVALELIAKQREHRVLVGSALGIGISLFLYLALVPALGLAAWAFLASEWLQAFFFFILRRNVIPKL